MDPKKSNVVKSKSSNSAITQKCTQKHDGHKKSRSNAEFAPNIYKKRGVYVEKKITKLCLNPENKTFIQKSPPSSKSPSPNRAPPRPRRDNKKFLASVLTMLSKRTTSTQYPDELDLNCEKENTRLRKRAIRKPPMKDKRDSCDKNAPKYRSKILNEIRKEDKKQVVILKRRKEISSTILFDSERSSATDARKSNISTSQKQTTDIKILKKEKSAHPESDTLVSQHEKKDEKGLVNFFVDLLETTFSVYSDKEEYDAENSPIGSLSKVTFEIDESVAKKLDVGKECEAYTEDPKKFNVKDDEIAEWTDQNLIENAQQTVKRLRSPTKFTRASKSPRSSRYSKSPAKLSRCSKSPAQLSRASKSPARSRVSRSPARTPKLHTQSFAYTQQFKIKPPATQSLIIPKHSMTKKSKKQTLLNILKEQLRMEDDAFEEPQTLYEALRVIARNKRKCRKAIQFDDNVQQIDEDFNSFCKKGRKVISSSTKSTNKYSSEKDLLKTFRTSSIMNSIYTRSKRKRDKDVWESSGHSIEVVGIDHEPTATRRRNAAKYKEIVYAVPSESDSEVPEPEIDDALFQKFAEAVVSSVDHRRANYGEVGSISEIIVDNLN